MKIEEAISHAREVAEGCPAEDRQCAYQHDQLADWLEELMAYRATGLSAADIQKAVDILKSTIRPDDLPKELESWVGRCTWHVKKCAELHKEVSSLTAELAAAKTDIAALLWLDGCCSYCRFAQKVEYSGANRWTCKLGGGAKCQPEWKGTQINNDGKE